MPRATHLLWIDLEATGATVHDPILEVGALITTTERPWAELASLTAVVRPEGEGWRAKMAETPVVVEMHTANGLISEVPEGEAIGTVEGDLIAMCASFGRKHDYLLAGSGVAHFDRKMIDAQMPALSKWLQYPALDVGHLRRALGFVDRKDLVRAGSTFENIAPGEKPHRALADIRDHLAEWRLYADMLSAIPTEGTLS